MPGESISQIPQQALTVDGLRDVLEISQYTGNPSALYVTRKINPLLLAGLAATTTATAIEFIVKSNPGYQITTGLAGYLVAPYGGIINGYAMLANTAGSISIDIWRCSYAQFDAGITHPAAGDSICGGQPPAIVSGVKAANNVPSGWTVNFNAGDVFAYDVLSTSGSMFQVTLSLNVTKTTIP